MAEGILTESCQRLDSLLCSHRWTVSSHLGFSSSMGVSLVPRIAGGSNNFERYGSCILRCWSKARTVQQVGT
jgi:hypothetical protein